MAVLHFLLVKAMSHSLKLTPEMERFAEEQVHAGNFKSVDEVARAAFSLLRENAHRRNASVKSSQGSSRRWTTARESPQRTKISRRWCTSAPPSIAANDENRAPP